jgi:hypothetical protein
VKQEQASRANGIPQAKRLHGPRQISWAKKAEIIFALFASFCGKTNSCLKALQND